MSTSATTTPSALEPQLPAEKLVEQPVLTETDSRWTNLEFLAMREEHAMGDRDLLSGAADLLARQQILLDQPAETPLTADQEQAILADIVATNQEKLTADSLLPNGLTVETTIADFRKLLRPTAEQQSAVFRDEFLKFPPEHRQLVYQELIELTLRGHLSAPLLTAVAGGGIRYRAGGETTAQQAGIDDKALFQPAHGTDPAYVVLTEQLFTSRSPSLHLGESRGEGEVDPRYALRHELAHALLYGLPGFFYNPADLDGYLGPRPTAAPDSQMQFSFDGPPPALSQTEQDIFNYALSPVGHNPRLVEPFETPYVATLLRRLEANPTDATLRGYVLNEMLAERLASYLSSDGSLHDFLKQRLERSFGYVGSEETGTAFEATAARLEGLLLQARKEQWPASKIVTSIQGFSQQQVPGMASFFRESIILWKRFDRLRGVEQLPMAVADQLPLESRKTDRRIKLTAWLGSGSTPRPLADYLADHQLSSIMHDNFKVDLGKPLPNKEGKSFWQNLSQFLAMISKLLTQ